MMTQSEDLEGHIKFNREVQNSRDEAPRRFPPFALGRCFSRGGSLDRLLGETTPSYYYYQCFDDDDDGPFSVDGDGSRPIDQPRG